MKTCRTEKKRTLPEFRTTTKAEWMEEGKTLFGTDDVMQWKFVCPSCGHVQSPEDFRPYKDRGIEPSIAFLSCIGRFLPKNQTTTFIGKQKKGITHPCDYTSGGLLNINPVTVIDGEKEVRVFEFAKGGVPQHEHAL